MAVHVAAIRCPQNRPAIPDHPAVIAVGKTDRPPPGARLLGKTPDPAWDRLLPKLKRGIEANRFGGVIRASRHPEAPPRVDTSYVGLFDCPADDATFRADLDYMMSPDGLLRWPNHGYKVVPWIHCNVSAALSRRGKSGAAEMLMRGAQFTTTLYAFPEAVRPDGVYSKTWYPTVHGSLVNAVNLLLVRSRNNQVDLFAGLPEEWGDASFETLRVPFGLVVSGSRAGGRISAKVTNDSSSKQSLRLHAFGAPEWEKTVELDPGQSVAL